ncbi:MAG: aminotransferase class III-fold pyridoxal phosphate-dependent enzyme [Gemmatimonadaceae bacterium]
MKPASYTIVATRSEGARFRDADGNDYVDFCMSFGAALFGHAPAFLQQALRDQIDRGFAVGPRPELASRVADAIARATELERVAFTCTGSEAIMLAIRAARTATLRRQVVVFADSNHGQYDATVVLPDPGGTPAAAYPNGPGIPPALVSDVLVLPYGSDHALSEIDRRRDELAAVLVEPIQSRHLDVQPRSFLHELRRLTADADIALVFDEMITGFRLAPGGAQEWFGVRADLAVYGKALAAGMPIGVLAGTSRFMNALDGGVLHFDDASTPVAMTTFFSSTFAKHPLSLAAAEATLHELAARGPALQRELNARTSVLVERLNACLANSDAGLRFVNAGSQFGLTTQSDADSTVARLLHYWLSNRGVFLWALNGFLATAHSAEDIERLIDGVQDAFAAAHGASGR